MNNFFTLIYHIFSYKSRLIKSQQEKIKRLTNQIESLNETEEKYFSQVVVKDLLIRKLKKENQFLLCDLVDQKIIINGLNDKLLVIKKEKDSLSQFYYEVRRKTSGTRKTELIHYIHNAKVKIV